MSTNENDKNESFASLFEQGGARAVRQRRLAIGDEVDGVVVKIGSDAVFLDLDGKREAFIERETLVDGEGKPLQVDIGDSMHARIAEMGGRAGGIRLEPVSIHRAPDGDEELNLDQVELIGATGPKLATGAHVKGDVVRVESYGVFVQVEGTTGRQGRGLLPAVETGLPRGTDLRKKLPVGTQVEVKILSIDDSGKMRLSIRALQADEERASFDRFSSKTKGAGKDKGAVVSSGFGTLADAFARSGRLKSKKR